MKDKITLDHLAPYIPYGLKVETVDGIFEVDGWGSEIGIFLKTMMYGANAIPAYKPILRPLSDLTKEITHNGETFVPIDYLNGEFAGKIPRKFEVNQTIRNPNIFFTLAEWISFKELHELFELLFSWHFDVFGLLDAGLAIDFNDLKEI